MTSMLMHGLMAALLIFLGYCLGRADGAMADARRKVGAGRTATEGHNVGGNWLAPVQPSTANNLAGRKSS